MQSLVGRKTTGGIPVAEADLRAALVAATIAPLWGVDVLDLTGTATADLTDDAIGCTISYNGDADIHRTVDLTITRELDWPNVRVRPWQSILGVRFYQGVFSLDTPEGSQQDGTFRVQGYDMLAGLRTAVGDSYTVAASSSVTSAMRAVIAASGLTGVTTNIDSAKDDILTAGPMVWALILSSPDTWLRVLNDLGASIAYRGAWADELGSIRAVPYVAPQLRPVEWTFDRTDPATDILDADVTITVDNWSAANWWRGVRRGLATLPTEGAGMVTLDQSAGGQKVRQFAAFDAADQTSLQTQFDAWVASQTQRTTTIDVTMGPLPILGHRDIVRYKDAARDSVCQIRTWEQDLPACRVKASLEVVDG